MLSGLMHTVDKNNVNWDTMSPFDSDIVKITNVHNAGLTDNSTVWFNDTLKDQQYHQN